VHAGLGYVRRSPIGDEVVVEVGACAGEILLWHHGTA